MNYVNRVVQPGENIRHIGRLSPIIFFRPALLILGGFFIGTATTNEAAPAIGLILILLGIIGLIRAWVKRSTTEIAVTDSRVIVKVGLLSRRTMEMNMNKVESVIVDQSILGRMFNFGSIALRGSGSGIEPIQNISQPLELRAAIGR